MAAGRPTRAAAQARRVTATADENGSRRSLLLEMALEAKIGVARDEHLRVHRAVRLVAGRAAFARGFVLEDERSALHRMALETRFVFGGNGSAASNDGRPAVRVVAVNAGDFARFERVVIGEVELPSLVQMTFEADAGKPGGVHDVLSPAPGFAVNAARTVA